MEYKQQWKKNETSRDCQQLYFAASLSYRLEKMGNYCNHILTAAKQECLTMYQAIPL